MGTREGCSPGGGQYGNPSVFVPLLTLVFYFQSHLRGLWAREPGVGR